MKRPFFVTFTPPLPQGWRTRTYATEESAIRHAEALCAGPTLRVASVRERQGDYARFVRGVEAPGHGYRERQTRSRAAEAAAGVKRDG